MTTLPILVDSHCHLDGRDFSEDIDDVVQRAFNVGVTRLLTMGTRFSTVDEVISLTEKYPYVYGAIGVHPEYADEESAVLTTDTLCEKAKHKKIIAIGEIGLDYHYGTGTIAEQKKIFRMQLKTAKEIGLPVCIHARDADEDIASILRQESDNGALKGVIHCFSSGRKLAETALDLGFYLSATGIITFNKSESLREIFRDIPLDRLLLETDCPYLAPVPYRGRRNEPSFLLKTAEKLAVLKSVSFEKIAEVTTKNFLKLFEKAK